MRRHKHHRQTAPHDGLINRVVTLQYAARLLGDPGMHSGQVEAVLDYVRTHPTSDPIAPLPGEAVSLTRAWERTESR